MSETELQDKEAFHPEEWNIAPCQRCGNTKKLRALWYPPGSTADIECTACHWRYPIMRRIPVFTAQWEGSPPSSRLLSVIINL